jgi:hypothetical protein
MKARYFFWAVVWSLFGITLLLGSWLSPANGPDITGIVFGVLLLIAGLFMGTELFRLRVVIGDDTLTVVRALSSRSILLDDIIGYRGENRRFYIVCKNGGKPLGVPLFISGRQEIIEWIVGNSEDINAHEHKSEMELFLENDRFGRTREDRLKRLQSGKKIDKIATVAGSILCLSGIVSTRPYGVLMSVVFLAPGIGIFLTWYFGGLFKMYKKKSSPYPSLVFLIGAPIVGALVCVFHSYDLYGPGLPNRFWSLLFGCTVLLTVICITVCRKVIKKEGEKLFIVCGIFVLAGIYSYSLLIFTNCYYDKSAAKKWPVKVVNREIDRGRIKRYHLTLSPWGRFKNDNRIEVSGRYFDKVQDADGITVYLETGIWGVPWYRVEK